VTSSVGDMLRITIIIHLLGQAPEGWMASPDNRTYRGWAHVEDGVVRSNCSALGTSELVGRIWMASSPKECFFCGTVSVFSGLSIRGMGSRKPRSAGEDSIDGCCFGQMEFLLVRVT
jgi:hypothetical protein